MIDVSNLVQWFFQGQDRMNVLSALWVYYTGLTFAVIPWLQ